MHIVLRRASFCNFLTLVADRKLLEPATFGSNHHHGSLTSPPTSGQQLRLKGLAQGIGLARWRRISETPRS
jgi:hypothetical protein